ncbi:MAG: transcription antitermination factor NusB [Gammaproteobacteria bacterium]|nr:transcription antitermination factor NusB [Gammaproteobacteria bacterium]
MLKLNPKQSKDRPILKLNPKPSEDKPVLKLNPKPSEDKPVLKLNPKPSEGKPVVSKAYAKRRKSRAFILQTLYQLVIHWRVNPQMTALERQECIDLAVEYTQALKGFAVADQEFYTEVLLASLAYQEKFDLILEKHLDRPMVLITAVEYCILWMSACQLSERWDIPKSVVINESLELAKIFGAQDAYKFINATMDLLAKVYHEPTHGD